MPLGKGSWFFKANAVADKTKFPPAESPAKMMVFGLTLQNA